MRKLLLAECVSGISVEETPVAALDHAAGSYGRRYRVTLHFYRWVGSGVVRPTVMNCSGCYDRGVEKLDKLETGNEGQAKFWKPDTHSGGKQGPAPRQRTEHQVSAACCRSNVIELWSIVSRMC